jgi:hypothetical protein
MPPVENDFFTDAERAVRVEPAAEPSILGTNAALIA